MNLTINADPEIARTVHSHIERIVGDINYADPQASVLTRMGYFVVDTFNSIADLYAKWMESKSALAQFEMRAKLQDLTKQLNKTPDLSSKYLLTVAEDFFNHSREVEKETLSWYQLGFPDLSNDPEFRMHIREASFNLLISTIHALSNARRNPISALSEKHIKQLKDVILQYPETTKPIDILDQSSTISRCWARLTAVVSTTASIGAALFALESNISEKRGETIESIGNGGIIEGTKRAASTVASIATTMLNLPGTIAKKTEEARESITTSWAWTIGVRCPWKLVIFPTNTTHWIFDTILPNFIPFKKMFVATPCFYVAYQTYHLMHQIPVIGPSIHAIVPFVYSHAADFTYELTKDALSKAATHAFEEIKQRFTPNFSIFRPFKIS